MRLFVEAELPDYCYVSEAAYWVALGRAPTDEREITENENREYIAVNVRLGDDALWSGDVADFGSHFQNLSFANLGLKSTVLAT